MVASLLFLIFSTKAQSNKSNVQLLLFTETISSLGAVAVDQNGEPLTPTKVIKYQMYLQVAKHKRADIKSIFINNQKVFFKLNETIEKSTCIGISNNTNDSCFVKPHLSNQFIQVFEINKFTPLKNKKLNKVLVRVSQNNKVKLYTFFIPTTALSPLVLFQ